LIFQPSPTARTYLLRITRYFLLFTKPPSPPSSPSSSAPLRHPLLPLRLSRQIHPSCPHRRPFHAAHRSRRRRLQFVDRFTRTLFFPLSSFLQLHHFSSFYFLLILTAHVFYNTTIIIRIVGNALSRLDPKLEQSARSSARIRFKRGGNHSAASSSLTARRRPARLHVRLHQFRRHPLAWRLELLHPRSGNLHPRLETSQPKSRRPYFPSFNSFTLIFSILYTRIINQVNTQTAPRFSAAKPAKTIKEKIFVASLCLLLSAFFLLPLLSLPIRSLTRLEADRGQRGEVQYGFTTDYYKELFINRRGSLFYVPPIQAAANSLGYAGVTVLLSLALGYPAAYALAKPTRLEKFLDPFIMLPLGASAVMLGLGFILSFGRGLPRRSSFPSRTTLIALPFVIRTLQPALASIPERLRQAASMLGASPFRVWQTVDFPILSRATLSAATFAFTVSLGEFGATLLITRPEYPTIPIAIRASSRSLAASTTVKPWRWQPSSWFSPRLHFAHRKITPVNNDSGEF
jgi:thiamine transport system permease protein